MLIWHDLDHLSVLLYDNESDIFSGEALLFIPNLCLEIIHGSSVCMQLHRAQPQRADGTQVK